MKLVNHLRNKKSYSKLLAYDFALFRELKMPLIEYINKFYRGIRHRSPLTGVQPAQVTQWINKDSSQHCIVHAESWEMVNI